VALCCDQSPQPSYSSFARSFHSSHCLFLIAILVDNINSQIDIPLPRQVQPGWTSETLSDPSIHGPDPSKIQFYCPATGQLIDTVVAATSADVDVAIEKAKAAQFRWRQTTFSQRALVLKTLLKLILEHQGMTTPFAF
jgi:delta 1-pyrroline-5-carboxylate dehydrogenase